MNQKSLRFRVTDALLIALIVLPLLCGMALKVLLFPPANGIEISGAKIFFTISAPVQDLPITNLRSTPGSLFFPCSACVCI